MKDARTGLYVPAPPEQPQVITAEVLAYIEHPEFRRDILAAMDRWGQIDWDQSSELADLIVAKLANYARIVVDRD